MAIRTFTPSPTPDADRHLTDEQIEALGAELDAIRAFAQTPGNTVVLGVKGLVSGGKDGRPKPRLKDYDPSGEV